MYALIAMLVAVFIYGVFPTAVALVGEVGTSTLIYLLYIHGLGLVFVFVAALLAYSRFGFGRMRQDFLSILSHKEIASKAGLSMLFNTGANGLLFYALLGENKLSSSVAYEAWPAIFILFTIVFRKDIGSFQFLHDRTTTTALLAISFLGLLTVAGSEIESAVTWDFLASSDGRIGSVLGLAAAICMAGAQLTATGTVRDVSQILDSRQAVQTGPSSVGANVRASLLTGVMFRLISFCVSLVLVLVFDDITDAGRNLDPPTVVAVVFSAFVVGLGGVLFHFANVSSRYSNINLIWYAVPVVAIFSLKFAGYQTVDEAGIFLGTLLIVGANFGLALGVDFSRSYKVSLISLCLFSYICTRMEGMFSTNYYDALAVGSVLFAVLIAFAIQRQHDLTTRIEGTFVKLRHSLLCDTSRDSQTAFQMLDKCGDQNAQLAALLNISKAQSTRKDWFLTVDELIGLLNRRVAFGELFAIWLLGLGTIFVAIIARPVDDYLSNFLPVVVSTAIVFLCMWTLEDKFKAFNPSYFKTEDEIEPNKGWLRQRYDGKRFDLYLSAGFVTVLFTLLFMSAISGFL